MEQYLRCYVNYFQADWYKWLPIPEFAANNQDNESTKTTPFLTNIGWNPRMTTDFSPLTKGDRDETLATTTVARMAEIHETMRTNMVDATQRYQD